MPPAGKASTVLKRSVVEATYGNNEDEINRLQNTLSSLTIDKERVSHFLCNGFYSLRMSKEDSGKVELNNRLKRRQILRCR
jgi:hypothetical protein